MSQNKVEREVLTLSLAGRDFKWERPVRKTARAQLAEIFDIVHVMQIEDLTQVSAANAADMLRAANMVLDFLYKWSPSLGQRRAYFDDAAEPRELFEVLRALQQFLLGPTNGSADSIPVQAEPETEETTD